jgi:hypothetical protein
VQVVVDPPSLTRSAQGQIAGIIYIELGGEAFPDNRWSDSVVVILEWWLNALRSLKTGHQSRIEFLFMDGPFRCELILDEGGHYRIALADQKGIQTSTTIDAKELDASLLRAARAVDRACFEREWRSPDLLQLQTAIRRFKQIGVQDRKRI